MESLNRLKDAHEREVLGEWSVGGSTVLLGRWSWGSGQVGELPRIPSGTASLLENRLLNPRTQIAKHSDAQHWPRLGSEHFLMQNVFGPHPVVWTRRGNIQGSTPPDHKLHPAPKHAPRSVHSEGWPL